MAATCARFIAIQRQNTPRRHIPTPRQIHQTLDKSRFIFRLSDRGFGPECSGLRDLH
jgi:hypothetical protein